MTCSVSLETKENVCKFNFKITIYSYLPFTLTCFHIRGAAAQRPTVNVTDYGFDSHLDKFSFPCTLITREGGIEFRHSIRIASKKIYIIEYKYIYYI